MKRRICAFVIAGLSVAVAPPSFGGQNSTPPDILARARTARGSAILLKGESIRLEGALKTSYGGEEAGTATIVFRGLEHFELDQVRPVLGPYRLSLTSTGGTLSTQHRPTPTPIAKDALRAFTTRWARTLFVYTLYLPAACTDTFTSVGRRSIDGKPFDVLQATGPCLKGHLAYFDTRTGELARLEFQSMVTSGGFTSANVPTTMPNPLAGPFDIVNNHTVVSDYRSTKDVHLPYLVASYDSDKMLEEFRLTTVVRGRAGVK